MNQEAYQAGYANGRLCRKLSWKNAYLDSWPELDPNHVDSFIQGCKDGWKHSSGALKV